MKDCVPQSDEDQKQVCVHPEAVTLLHCVALGAYICQCMCLYTYVCAERLTLFTTVTYSLYISICTYVGGVE